jgi:hypothetical protein
MYIYETMSVLNPKKQIDEIFACRSIYKSLIVCQDNFTMLKLYHNMRYDHYPVANITHLDKFRANNSRILFIDHIDYKNIDKLLEPKDIDMINAIFFVGCDDEEHTHSLFKDDNLKYYIIK